MNGFIPNRQIAAQAAAQVAAQQAALSSSELFNFFVNIRF